jgi:hypothetical protein
MTNYVSRFIPDYSTTTEPLRRLTKKNAAWQWNHEQQKAFDKLKNDLSSDIVMTYFDPHKKTQLVVDASLVGLGSVMLQERKVVAQASKSLTDVEKRYSQTEREALAIVWSMENFHLYLFGHSFELITDHKALETIFNNPKSKPPARFERWRLRLQAYSFTITYRKGESNISDYISRHPDKGNTDNQFSEIAEEFVCHLVFNNVPKSMNLSEINQETQKDPDIQTVIGNLKNGTWNQTYKNSTLDTSAW